MNNGIITFIALLAPATSFAGGPIVWHHVSDNDVEKLSDADDALFTARERVWDHRYALDVREDAVDRARDQRKEARQMRRATRKATRHARRDYRKADRKDEGLQAATMHLTRMERELDEAHDYVDLQKERVQARKQHVDLEEARLSRARADLEWQESVLREEQGERGVFELKPKRYAKQYERVSRQTREEHAEWDLARVDVRERYQDWMNPGLKPEPVVVSAFVIPSESGASASGSNSTMQHDSEDMDLRRVYFDLGSSTLDTDSLNDLAWNAHVLRNHRDVTIRVEGHTDATGAKALNRELAWERAAAIEDFLEEQGVWSSQIETVAYGEKDLLVDTQEPLRLNRRAELRVIEDPDGLVDGTVEMTDDYWTY